MKNIVWICIILLLVSCKKEENKEASIPVVTTTAVTEIGGSAAGSGGNITSDGGSTIISRGVCWGLSNNPTIQDSHTSDGSGMGSFTSEMTNLIQRTDYYVRAYAKNGIGIAYGNSVQFTTTSAFVEGNYIYTIDNFDYYATLLPSDTILFRIMENDTTQLYDCKYEYKGKLMSDQPNGFIVVGNWYKFLRLSGSYPSIYFIVQQKDEQSIIIKSSEVGYESAYQLGQANIYNKY